MNIEYSQFGDVEIQADGKIVVMGRVINGTVFDIGLLRLNADGTPDNSFGTNGEVHDVDATYSDPTGDISWVDIPIQESAETKHRQARAVMITGL
jgi:hypothetical protein